MSGRKRGRYKEFLKEKESEEIPTSTAHSRKRRRFQEQASSSTAEKNEVRFHLYTSYFILFHYN